jgi:tRNA threonylcarbamoyladenosine biosynthesis protein TsaB
MRVLALDTTTRAGSVALVEDSRLVDEQRGDPARTHAERLPGELLALLDRAGVALSAVDAFAVVAGPGSFTGIRIGIATVQGLALATGRPAVSASAFELLARWGADRCEPGATVGVWIDAHRGEVFAALYRVGDRTTEIPDGLLELDPARVDRPGVVLSEWTTRFGRPDALVGEVDAPYAADASDLPWLGRPALAGLLGHWAVARVRRGAAVHPAALQPVYVRRPDAEIARERTAAGHARANDRST